MKNTFESNANENIKSEIKALYDYVNRDIYNIKVVEVMIEELHTLVKRLLFCEMRVCDNEIEDKLTQEEFDLLKEMI